MYTNICHVGMTFLGVYGAGTLVMMELEHLEHGLDLFGLGWNKGHLGSDIG
jgi:hypothetical protein